MRSYEDLEALWHGSPPAPRDRGAVRLIVLRKGGGVHETPARAELSPERGLHGDSWADDPERELDCQITLMNARAAELVAADTQPLHMPGDNFLVELELAEEALPAGTRLRLGTALLEVTAEPHLGCKKFSARFGADALRWVNHKDNRPRRLRGVNCRVLEGGVVAVGDLIERVDRRVD
jgi:MOSC domain-containing protein YiiM